MNIQTFYSMSEQDILAQAISKLQETSPGLAVSMNSPEIRIGDYTFRAIVKRSVTMTSINYLVEQIKNLPPSTSDGTILVTTYIYPKLAAALAECGIASLDCSGNCFISRGPLFINISGQKKVVNTEDKSPFVDSELKLIFFLLSSDDNLQKTYRQMCRETGLSLGTISNCIEKLSRDGILVKNGNRRFFANKKALIDTWQLEYNQSMKRKLYSSSYTFISQNARQGWKDIVLPEGMCWGGEGGAYILDGYLKPEKFTLYTDTGSSALLRTGKVIPAEKGEIRVYRKFWKEDNHTSTAPRLLIYADLMGSGDSRCIDAANRILSHEN